MGAGEAPRLPGTVTLDLRDLPGIEVVADARDLSQFDDGYFDEIHTRDMVEHLPYRDVPDAIEEWLRVLAPAGRLVVETPDARYAAILALGIDAITRLSGESDWMHFNRVMFGHQDYPENHHHSYWTPEWLREILLDSGATRVEDKGTPIYGSFELWAWK